MVSQLLLGVIGMLPSIAVLYMVIGAHEAHFRHQAIFLGLIAGLFLGLAVALVEFLVLSDVRRGETWLVAVVAFPLVETMGKTMIVGLPRFRGQDETVFVGGAAGLGLGAMLLMFYHQFVVAEATAWQLLLTLGGVSIGLTLSHFVSGLQLGVGPAEGRLFAKFLPSAAILLPAHLLFAALAILGSGRPFGGPYAVGLLLALYGIAISAWLLPSLVRRGLPPAERAKWRRAYLRKARADE